MDRSERRRYDRSWKLAASLLGIVALVAASATASVVELDSPWEVVIYFAVMAVVLVAGTLWLVPSARVGQELPDTARNDPRRRPPVHQPPIDRS